MRTSKDDGDKSRTESIMIKYVVIGIGLFLLIGGVYVLFLWTPPVQPSLDIRFGFIDRIETNGGLTIVFDDAEWLTGTEGENAAIEARLCTEKSRETCLPNDFFILNSSTSTVTITLLGDAIVAMQTLNMEEEGVKETQISAAEFERLINDPTLHWSKIPYQILLEDGRITIIEEVYVP